MDVYLKVTEKLDMNESIQLVGFSGSGKSWLIHRLTPHIFDCNLLNKLDSKDWIELIQKKLKNSTEKIDKKTILVFDNFNLILDKNFKPLFDFLMSARMLSHYNLKFIFSISGVYPISHQHKDSLGNLYKVVNENIIYMQPISKDELGYILERDFDLKSNQLNLNEIYNKSGGIRSLVKILINNKSESFLNSQLEILSSQINKNLPQDILKEHGLINDSGEIISLLLRDYINKDTNKILTHLESQVFEILKNNLGNIVSKDQICEVAYPDVKNINGISDEAINQIIHRIRKKIAGCEIINIHGRGYELNYF